VELENVPLEKDESSIDNISSTRNLYQLGHRSRTIEKFLKNSDNFLNTDLIELMLFLTIPRKDTKILAKLLIQKYNNFLTLFSVSPDELNKIPGLGRNSILFIKLIYELSLRLSLEKLQKKDILSSFSDLIQYCKLKIASKKSEELRIIYLTSKNSIIKDEILFQGTISSVNIYPREVVQKCLENGAAGIILVHNHPSGDPTPSSEDIEITKGLYKILLPIGIALCDHLIIGGSSFISFRQNKIAPFNER
jgi:DNA repair protein RadC